MPSAAGRCISAGAHVKAGEVVLMEGRTNSRAASQKEAAFYRDDAARAKDEAMLTRQGMWLGLMVTLACVCAAILDHLFR